MLSSVVDLFVQAILETMLSSRDTETEKWESLFLLKKRRRRRAGKDPRDKRCFQTCRLRERTVQPGRPPFSAAARPCFQLLSLTDTWRSISFLKKKKFLQCPESCVSYPKHQITNTSLFTVSIHN